MYHPHYDPAANALLFLPGPAAAVNYFCCGANVFVCGSLQDPQKMAELLGRRAPFAPAVVFGYQHRLLEIDGGKIPSMLPVEPGAVLTGIAWLDLDDQELKKIESVELAGNLRRRIEVEALAGDQRFRVFTYVKA